MAKKDKKDKKKDKGQKNSSGAVDALEAVRSAVERTFQATAESAAGTQKRTQGLVEEIATAAARVKDTIEDLKVLEDVRSLRSEIAALSARVTALETTVKATAQAAPKPAATRRPRSATKTGTAAAAKKPDTARATAARTTGAKKPTPARSRSTGTS